MKGFFSVQETQSKTRADGKVYSCSSCGLLKQCQTPLMKPIGKFEKGILIVLPHPSKINDDYGQYGNDKNIRFLKKELDKLGISLMDDCLITGALKCYPGDKSRKSGKALTYEASCCRRFLLKTIDDYQPSLILTFGDLPIFSLLGHRWKKNLGTMYKWRGWQIPDQDFKAWVCPMLDISFVQNSDNEVGVVFRQDLGTAVECLNRKFKRWKKPKIDYLEKDDLSVLDTINSAQIAIDYETTGIKPHAKGHRIICASVADTPDHAYVFMMPKSRIDREPFIKLLKNGNIGKLAQNMKFEDHWTTVRLKTEIQGWDFDSMLASHLLDNREEITGLKFQTYVQFGIVDYSSEIDPFLKAVDSKNSNAINRIEELVNTPHGAKKLMEYCAMDTITQYRLSMQQVDIMNYSFLPF